MKDGKYFQRPFVDFNTFIHFVGSVALTSFLDMFMSMWGVSWEYAQATAYKSEERIDPADLVADALGIALASTFLFPIAMRKKRTLKNLEASI